MGEGEKEWKQMLELIPVNSRRTSMNLRQDRTNVTDTMYAIFFKRIIKFLGFE